MKIQTLFSCLAVLVVLSGYACKHKHYMPGTLPEKQIRWGTGGGFVGKESYYILLENGQVFQHEATMGDSLAEIQSVKRSIAKSMFKAADEAGISTLDFNHPANMYSFLQYSGKRVVWGDKKFPVAAPVNELYGKLNMMVNKDKTR